MSAGPTARAREVGERTLARLAPLLSGIALGRAEVNAQDGMPCLEPEPAALRALLERLKSAGFETMTLVTGVDRLPAEPRFEVVHQLHSLLHGERVRVRTRVAGADPRVPTCVDLWPGAAFMERECFDLFGIVFAGHPNLRRLLMPDEYGHHPLRKDFPHQGIQPDRLYREWDRQRRAEWKAAGA